MAKKNDFNLDDLVNADRHQQDIEGLSTRIKVLEEKFGTNEKIADTLCEASEKASRMDEMIAKRFLKLLQHDVGIKTEVGTLVNKLDRNYFFSSVKRIGMLLVGFLYSILLLVIGAAIAHYWK